MMILVIAAAGICLIIGVLSPRKAKAWIGYVVLLLITAPLVDVFMGWLPGGLLIVLTVAAAWMFVRFIAEALLGREGAAHMMGILAADVVRAAFRLVLFLAIAPFRLGAMRFEQSAERSLGLLVEGDMTMRFTILVLNCIS